MKGVSAAPRLAHGSRFLSSPPGRLMMRAYGAVPVNGRRASGAANADTGSSAPRVEHGRESSS